MINCSVHSKKKKIIVYYSFHKLTIYISNVIFQNNCLLDYDLYKEILALYP